jgi:hypothetical protein
MAAVPRKPQVGTGDFRFRNIDSRNRPFGFNTCVFSAGRRLFQQHRPKADIAKTLNHLNRSPR